MRYYQCDRYPIEFVVSEYINKRFDSHNHAGHYVISVVMQGTVTVCLENREVACFRGDVFVIPPFAMHSVGQGRDARLLSMCIGTAFIEENDRETAEGIVRDLLKDAAAQGIFGWEQEEKLLASVRTVYRLRDNGRKIAPDCSIGNHVHETQLETHEVIKGSGKCVNADSTIPYEPGTISIMQAGVPHEVTAGSEGLFLFAKFMPALC